MEKVKIGVIGVKGIGRTHINSIVSSENADLLAIADINEEAGKTAASNYKVEWYKNYEEMLELEDLDAVTICTPHFPHSQMALKALDHDKHVLVEKPMAISVSEADEMIQRSRKKGLKLGVVFQVRTMPINREIKRLIDSGEIGEIYRACIEACYFRTQAYYNRDAWRGKWATEGGGVLINQAIHDIDLMQWFLGRPIKIQGQIDTVYHDIQVEDLASATMLFENGAQGIFQASTIDPMQTKRLEVCGDKGKIELNGGARYAVLKKTVKEYIASGEAWDNKQEFQWFEIKPKTEMISGHRAVIEDFAQAILSDREPSINGEEGRKALEILNAIILSSFEGKAVSLPINRKAYDDLLERLKKKQELPS